MKPVKFIDPKEIGVNPYFDRGFAEAMNARFNSFLEAFAQKTSLKPGSVKELAAEILSDGEIKQD